MFAACLAVAARNAEKYCEDSTGTTSRCFARPALVSSTPSVHRVCDIEKESCFKVAVIPGARRGPSHEVENGAWGESAYLKDIYDYVLGGNCTRANGRRKVVVDGERLQCCSWRCSVIDTRAITLTPHVIHT
jgi:hypothetical protein